MTYTVVMARAAHRTFKKLDPPVQQRIKAEMEKIAADPHGSPRLGGMSRPIRSQHLTFKGVHWCIAYSVDDVAAVITVLLVGVRENFYDKLKRLL